MTHGLSIEQLGAEAMVPLPDRNTMSLVTIGALTLLNGVNILNNTNIGAMVNLLADGNENEMEQSTHSELITCVVGASFGINKCHGAS